MVWIKDGVGQLENTSVKMICDAERGFDSNGYVNKMISNKKPFLLLTGEGDYFVPWKSVENQMLQYWAIPGEEDFWAMDWKKNEDFMSKKLYNFEWRKVFAVGHHMWIDRPELHEKMIVEFLDKYSLLESEGESHAPKEPGLIKAQVEPEVEPVFTDGGLAG